MAECDMKEDARTLINRADRAPYAAKGMGRNRVLVAEAVIFFRGGESLAAYRGDGLAEKSGSISTHSGHQLFAETAIPLGLKQKNADSRLSTFSRATPISIGTSR